MSQQQYGNVPNNAQAQQAMATQFAQLQAQRAQYNNRHPGHQAMMAQNQNFNQNPNNQGVRIPMHMNPALNAFRIGMNGPPLPVPQAQADDNDEEEEEEEEEFLAEDPNALSRINIVIRSPIIITGNSNLIACDAAATANAIALGVVQSLRQLSMGQHGVPMIDEQGRPRPLGVEVIAEMRVEGSQNVVGERAVLARMLDLKEKVAKRKMELAKAAAHGEGCVLGVQQGHEHGNGCVTAEVNGVAANAVTANNGVVATHASMIGGPTGNEDKIKLEKKRDRESSERDDEDTDVKRSRRNF